VVENLAKRLLSKEVENKLRIELSALWSEGFSARQIFEKLRFGQPGSPYEKLTRVDHVYHYQYFRFKLGPHLPTHKRVFMPKKVTVEKIKKPEGRQKTREQINKEWQAFDGTWSEFLSCVAVA